MEVGRVLGSFILKFAQQEEALHASSMLLGGDDSSIVDRPLPDDGLFVDQLEMIYLTDL